MNVWVVMQQVFSEHPYDEGEDLVAVCADALTAMGALERHAQRAIDRGYDPVIYGELGEVRLEKVITTRSVWTSHFERKQVDEPCTPYVTTDAVYYVRQVEVEGTMEDD